MKETSSLFLLPKLNVSCAFTLSFRFALIIQDTWGGGSQCALRQQKALKTDVAFSQETATLVQITDMLVQFKCHTFLFQTTLSSRSQQLL